MPLPILDQLSLLERGEPLGFGLGEIPLEELLLRLHVSRFTGSFELGVPGGRDHLFFREGGLVGMRAHPEVDRPLLHRVLGQLGLLTRIQLSVFPDQEFPDGVTLARALIERGLVSQNGITRAVEEQVRRRLFQLYDLDPATPCVVELGLDTMAYFHPVHVDVRPAISFGFVMRSDAERREELAQRMLGRRVRLIGGYDEQRNSYGLPPPVLLAMRSLCEGLDLGETPSLSGLSAHESLGLLLLLDRMSLLSTS